MKDVNRRTFLKGTLLTAAALSMPPGLAGCRARAAAEQGALPLRVPVGDLVDTNVYLFRWPFRRMPGDEPAALVSMLRGFGVQQAWAGSFEGLFHKDLSAVNSRLAEAARTHGDGLLVPFGSVNPKLPGWAEVLRRCHEEHAMPGIRVHPGYHNYTLDDPDFERLLAAATERGLIVQVVPWMQDERHHNPLMRVPTPDLTPLADYARALPAARLMVLNSFRAAQGDELKALANTGRIWVDFAKVDVIDGLGRLLTNIPQERVVFGSYAPQFHFEAALLKMQESVLSGAQIRALAEGNARAMLAQA